RQLTFGNRGREHTVRALPRAFDEATACKRVRQAPIARRLPLQNVLRRDACGESPRAIDLDPPGILLHKYRPTEAVVAMADGVENGLSYRRLVEAGDLAPEESVLQREE